MSTHCVIQIVDDPGDQGYAGLYIKSFDPYTPDERGRGELTVTPNKDDARIFVDVADALKFWKQESPIVPFRDDGLPNRPLTAYSITFEPV